MVKLKFRQSRKPIRISFFSPVKLNTSRSVRKIPLKNLTWPQASLRFPRMNPFGDKDRDGKLNMFDCKPFDKRKHGKFSQNIPIDEAKYMTLYHGTNEPRAKKIMQEGLKPHTRYQYDQKIKTIHMTARLATALAHASTGPESALIEEENFPPAILKVTLPIEEIKSAQYGTNPNFLRDQYEHVRTEPVHPSRIKKLNIHKAINKMIHERGKTQDSNLSDNTKSREIYNTVTKLKKGMGEDISSRKYQPPFVSGIESHKVKGWEEWTSPGEDHPETLQVLDTNDNQIPDTSEDVDIEPIQIKDED